MPIERLAWFVYPSWSIPLIRELMARELEKHRRVPRRPRAVQVPFADAARPGVYEPTQQPKRAQPCLVEPDALGVARDALGVDAAGRARRRDHAPVGVELIAAVQNALSEEGGVAQEVHEVQSRDASGLSRLPVENRQPTVAT